MIWISLYAAVGVFVALALFLALNQEHKLDDTNAGSIVLVFLLIVAGWPALAIYRYCI